MFSLEYTVDLEEGQRYIEAYRNTLQYISQTFFLINFLMKKLRKNFPAQSDLESDYD